MAEKMENKEKRKVGEDNCGNVVWGVSKNIDNNKNGNSQCEDRCEVKGGDMWWV
jgi:hypothetical protein